MSRAEFVSQQLGLPASQVSVAAETDGSFSDRFEIRDIDGRRWFAKTLPSDVGSLEFCNDVGLFEKERRFYVQVSRDTNPKSRTVLCFPEVKHSSDGLLVLAHLCDAGFEPCKPAKPISNVEMQLLLSALAEFHIGFPADLEGFAPRHEWPGFGPCVAPLVADGISKLRHEGWLEAETIQALESCPIVETLTSAVEGPHVFCHGDCWLGNWFLKLDSQKAALIDFQFVGPSCAADDVIALMFTSMEGCVRRQHQAQLLEHYVSAYPDRGLVSERFKPSHWRHGAALAAVILLADLTLFPRELLRCAFEDIAELYRSSAS